MAIGELKARKVYSTLKWDGLTVPVDRFMTITVPDEVIDFGADELNLFNSITVEADTSDIYFVFVTKSGTVQNEIICVPQGNSVTIEGVEYKAIKVLGASGQRLYAIATMY